MITYILKSWPQINRILTTDKSYHKSSWHVFSEYNNSCIHSYWFLCTSTQTTDQLRWNTASTQMPLVQWASQPCEWIVQVLVAGVFILSPHFSYIHLLFPTLKSFYWTQLPLSEMEKIRPWKEMKLSQWLSYNQTEGKKRRKTMAKNEASLIFNGSHQIWH